MRAPNGGVSGRIDLQATALNVVGTHGSQAAPTRPSHDLIGDPALARVANIALTAADLMR